jgi:hypothetical protein
MNEIDDILRRADETLLKMNNSEEGSVGRG